jgi:hypothetical protein
LKTTTPTLHRGKTKLKKNFCPDRSGIKDFSKLFPVWAEKTLLNARQVFNFQFSIYPDFPTKNRLSGGQQTKESLLLAPPF